MHFHLKGCREHNLKNLSLQIPKEKIVTITGVSGSGKSSLAFFTLYAEAKARFLEQLAPEVKSLYKLIQKPKVDSITGLTPALGSSRVATHLQGQTTLASFTDIYNLLAELYSKLGKVLHPKTGEPLLRYTRAEMAEEVFQRFEEGAKIQVLAPTQYSPETLQEMQERGFIRFLIDGQEYDSEDHAPLEGSRLEVIVDRLKLDPEARLRLLESLETALSLGGGVVWVQEGSAGKKEQLSEIFFSPDLGLSFAPLEPEDFKPTLKRGACPTCKGQGSQLHVAEQELVWDDTAPFADEVHRLFDFLPKTTLDHALDLYGEDTLTSAFFEGQGEWVGLNSILQTAIKKGKPLPSYIHTRVCPTCDGRKLKREALLVKIANRSIDEVEKLSINEMQEWIRSLDFQGKEHEIAEEIYPEIERRLELLDKAGLHYLELHRPLSTLSYGERGRTQLASLLGAKFTGLLYVFDEPSLGLHTQDLDRLRDLFLTLKEEKNHLVLVEHRRELIEVSDQLIEMGPQAGRDGGEILFQGTVDEMKQSRTPTGRWLSTKTSFPKRKPLNKNQPQLYVRNAQLHNLQNLSLDIPLNSLVVFAGVSGSGKSSLAIDLIGDELKNGGPHVESDVDFQTINTIQEVDVKPTPRSIVATFAGLFDPIRKLYAGTKLASSRGWGASRFSLNVRGGRCEACKGMGMIKVPFSMIEDLYIPCDVCHGNRYSFDTLQVTWKGLHIADLLKLTVKEAKVHFEAHPQLSKKLNLMSDLGLDYLPLGESLPNLSGGELQRLKLVRELIEGRDEPTLYLLDEPSKGLHFQDIQKLIEIFQKLKRAGHSLFIIEHELSLIAHADWVIELGPEAGPRGGHLLFEGTPEKLLKENSPTAKALKKSFS